MGVNFPTNLRYNIYHYDLQISRQAELLLQIVPDSLRFHTAIWKQVNRETDGDRRRQSQAVPGSPRQSQAFPGSPRQSPALLRLYGNQALMEEAVCFPKVKKNNTLQVENNKPSKGDHIQITKSP